MEDTAMSHDFRIGGLPSFQAFGLPARSPVAGTAVASAERDVNATLDITTKDGDTFSISADFDAMLTYGRAGGSGRGGQFTANRSVSVSMQGEFSAQELRDISRVVRTFLHDLRAMLRGRDVSIANVGSGRSTTLDSVAATAETTTTFTVVASGSTPPAPVREHEGTPDADGDESQDAATGRLVTIGRPAPAPEPVQVPVSEASAAA
jgi:hypothetical protein